MELSLSRFMGGFVQDDYRDTGGREHTALPLRAPVHPAPPTLHSDHVSASALTGSPSIALIDSPTSEVVSALWPRRTDDRMCLT
jgi:hypothetical protein